MGKGLKKTNLAAYFLHPKDQDLELLLQQHLQQEKDYSKQHLKHSKMKIHCYTYNCDKNIQRMVSHDNKSLCLKRGILLHNLGSIP